MHSGKIFVPDSFDIQGHRGARGLLPENSIPAFRKALELGVTTLELDVVISKDMQVVVSHDPFMSSELCLQPDGTPVVASEQDQFALFAMDYEVIRQFDCGSRGNPRFPHQLAEPVAKPLLAEVLAFAESFALTMGGPPPRYNIETKSTPAGDGSLHPGPEEFAGLLFDTIVAGGVAGRSTIQSFDPRTLKVAHALRANSLDAGELSMSLLVSRNSPSWTGQIDWLGFAPEILSPDYRLVDEALMQDARSRNMQVLPWTVNETNDMAKLVALGVDGLITDYPDRALRLVGRLP